VADVAGLVEVKRRERREKKTKRMISKIDIYDPVSAGGKKKKREKKKRERGKEGRRNGDP